MPNADSGPVSTFDYLTLMMNLYMMGICANANADEAAFFAPYSGCETFLRPSRVNQRYSSWIFKNVYINGCICNAWLVWTQMAAGQEFDLFFSMARGSMRKQTRLPLLKRIGTKLEISPIRRMCNKAVHYLRYRKHYMPVFRADLMKYLDCSPRTFKDVLELAGDRISFKFVGNDYVVANPNRPKKSVPLTPSPPSYPPPSYLTTPKPSASPMSSNIYLSERCFESTMY